MLVLLPHEYLFKLNVLVSQGLNLTLDRLLLDYRGLELFIILFQHLHLRLHVCYSEGLILYNFSQLLRQVRIPVANAERGTSAITTLTTIYL